MPIIRFATNVPQEVRLINLEGRVVDSQFGGQQHMFMAAEGAFYVSDKVGAILTDQFRRLGVKPGEPVEICKSETGNGPGRKTQWIVSVVVAGGFATISEQKVDVAPPPSELEQKLAESIAAVEQRKQAQRAPAAAAAPVWADHLVAQSNALIDAYSQVLTHASKYPNVRGEDVRSIFLSTFINVTKSVGGRNAA